MTLVGDAPARDIELVRLDRQPAHVNQALREPI